MSNLAGWIQAIGALFAGGAACIGAWNSHHIAKLRREVNGQTHLLVSTTHALGVTEGVAQAQSAAFERGDTKGQP